MALPLILSVIATVAAAFVAYGVHPNLAEWSSGLTMIMLSRRLMWPLVTASLLCCIALIGLVIAGKRRAWWLIGLAPVLALFVHRFGPGSPGPAAVIEMPPMLAASDAAAPQAGDWVVGVVFADRPYAFPYRALFARPVVSLVDYDKRMLLMWSAYANRATAVNLTREIRPRDLEVVSNPANSILIYDRRLGQFICGVTGRLADGGEVIGFSRKIETIKTTWSDWKLRHPDTLVMAGWNDAGYPSRPILPRYKTPVPPVPDHATVIAMLATTQPAAARDDAPLSAPANLKIGDATVVLLRDRSGHLRAYDRHLKEDLFLTFEPAPNRNRKRQEGVMSDIDSRSWWTIDGRCIDGPLKGEHLRAIEVEEGLYWGVMKYWYPKLELIEAGG